MNEYVTRFRATTTAPNERLTSRCALRHCSHHPTSHTTSPRFAKLNDKRTQRGRMNTGPPLLYRTRSGWHVSTCPHALSSLLLSSPFPFFDFGLLSKHERIPCLVLLFFLFLSLSLLLEQQTYKRRRRLSWPFNYIAQSRAETLIAFFFLVLVVQ